MIPALYAPTSIKQGALTMERIDIADGPSHVPGTEDYRVLLTAIPSQAWTARLYRDATTVGADLLLHVRIESGPHSLLFSCPERVRLPERYAIVRALIERANAWSTEPGRG